MRTALPSLSLPLLSLLLFASTALGQPSRCSTPPRPPGCLERLGSTADNQAVAYCRAEVNDYRRRMDRYIDCLSDEADRGRRERDRAESRLDCYARGGSICP